MKILRLDLRAFHLECGDLSPLSAIYDRQMEGRCTGSFLVLRANGKAAPRHEKSGDESPHSKARGA